MNAEERLHECMIGLADLVKAHLAGEKVDGKMRKQIRKYEKCWADMAVEFIKEVRE